jgi:outer membrane protein assembly factor BamB
MVSANVDSDPQREVFLTEGGGATGGLVAFDGKTHAQEWRRDLTAFGALRTLAIADVDRDGRLELVASVGGDQGDADGLFVYVFDAQTGNLEWRSPSLSIQRIDGLYPLRIAQLDDDPQPEIVVRESEGSIRVLDAVKRGVEAETGDLDISAFDLRDLDGDGKAEILAAAGGDLSVLDPRTGRLGAPLAAYSGLATSLRALDLNGDGTVDFLLASDRVRVFSGATGAELWKSPDLGYFPGFGDGLFVGDFDGDGQMEFAVSAGTYGLVLYEVRR